MHRRPYWIVSLICLIALLVPSSDAKAIVTSNHDSAASTTDRKPAHANGSLVAYRLESDIDLTVDADQINGSCRISILKTDSIRMTFHGPFGIVLGELSACPTSMVYFDALKTEVLEGDPQSPAMEQRMPIPLSYNDIIHLMRCEVPYADSTYAFQEKFSNDTARIYSYAQDERFVDFAKISPRDGSLLTYQRKARNGEILMNIKFSDYQVRSGVVFPKTITMSFPQRNLTARFVVTDLVINPKNELYTFTLPKGVKHTKLD